MSSRYDGVADWYDTEFQPDALESEQWETLVRLLDKPSGELLDIGCGTGAYDVGLTALGWDVTGVDVSEDMLRRARAKGVSALQADATSLPFDDASFDAAISMFTHTDFDDFPAVLREIARVLKPAARFVYLGPHPCFVGPHSEFVAAEGAPVFHEGWYRQIGAYDEAPGRSGAGLRIRIGTSFHRPLAVFLQEFLDAGFQLERIEEPEQREYAYTIATRWRR